MVALYKNIKKIASVLNSNLEEESLERAKNYQKIAAKKFKNTFLVFCIVIFSAVTLWTLMLPPRSINEIIDSNPTSYYKFREGAYFFSASTRPEEIPARLERKISLPDRSISSSPNFDPKNIWYRFKIVVPDQIFKNGNSGVLVPKVWGKSKIFINDTLRDFGTNVWPVLALEKQVNIVSIKVDAEGFEKKQPIRATYPLIVSDIDKLRELTKIVDAQAETRPRAFIAYGLSLLIFGMLFLAYPRKPELFAFIVFLTTAFINSVLTEIIDEKNMLLSGSHFLQSSILTAFNFSTELALLIFSLLFLRAHPKSVTNALKIASLIFIFLALPSTTFLQKIITKFDFTQARHLAVSIAFLAIQLWFVVPRLVFLISKKQIPLQRKVGGSIVFAFIISFYALNILDHFFYLTRVTTLYSNGLILNLALAIAVAFEISRAETNQNLLGSMLPKEVREGLHLAKKSINKKGFIILFDAIGYAAHREKLDDAELRSDYLENLAGKMLSPASQLDLSEFSILSCTGDGLYCSIRGEPTEANFNSAVSLVKSIVFENQENEICFRAAIGYGSYGVKIIEYGNLRKEFVAGNILNDLARIIGNDFGTIRVLSSPKVASFLTSSHEFSIIDKHGFTHTYWELKDKKRAA